MSDDRTAGSRPSRTTLADRLMGRNDGADAESGPLSQATPNRPEAGAAPADSAADRPQEWRSQASEFAYKPAGQAASAADRRTDQDHGPAGTPGFSAPAQAADQETHVQPRVQPESLERTGAAVSAVPAPASGSAAKNQATPEESATARVSSVLHGKGNTRRTRKARLRLASVDPWSVMKMAFLFSLAIGIATVVAVSVIWFVISTSGLFDSINAMVNDAFSAPGDSTPFDLLQYLNAGRVIGSAVLLAVIDIMLWTALATVGAFLYNTGATLLGGLEVTLADD